MMDWNLSCGVVMLVTVKCNAQSVSGGCIYYLYLLCWNAVQLPAGVSNWGSGKKLYCHCYFIY